MAHYWAYDFTCEATLAQMYAAFSAAGPWTWFERDSAWYGDYLSSHPSEGVRIRVHEYPFEGEMGTFIGLREKGFSVLLDIKEGSAVKHEEVDAVFRKLLALVNAEDLTEIEPYD